MTPFLIIILDPKICLWLWRKACFCYAALYFPEAISAPSVFMVRDFFLFQSLSALPCCRLPLLMLVHIIAASARIAYFFAVTYEKLPVKVGKLKSEKKNNNKNGGRSGRESPDGYFH